jgi:anti-anti-sigma factor
MTRIGDNCFEPLRIDVERRGDAMVVFPSGEIDLTSADRLRNRVLGLLEGCPRLVIDLREVVFIDASGLHCILDVDWACRVAGVDFGLVPGPPEVQRIFRITRTDEILKFF